MIDLERHSRQLQLEIKGEPLLCRRRRRRREGGRLEVRPAPRPPVPDVLLSPCPIMLDNCTAHHRLRPCPLDIKVQRLAGHWALQSFELVLNTAVTQTSRTHTHTHAHIHTPHHLTSITPEEALSGLQVPRLRGTILSQLWLRRLAAGGLGGGGLRVYMRVYTCVYTTCRPLISWRVRHLKVQLGCVLIPFLL